MNGRGNGISFSSRSVSNSADRNLSSDVLFPRGSNMSPLSNQNYYANITQASGSVGSTFQSQSNGSSPRQAYLQRLDSARAPPSYSDSFGNKRLMPGGYHQTPLAEKSAQSITSTAATETAVGAVSAGRSLALTAAGGPGVAMAAQAAQQVGQGIGNTLKANDESKSMKDFAKNSQIASVGNSQSAALIRNAQQDTINKNYNASMIGSLFGPLGALAGHFVSSLVNQQETPVFGVNSFHGEIDPTDSGINRSLNSAAASGKSEMVDSINGN